MLLAYSYRVIPNITPLVTMRSSKLGAKAAIKYEDDDAKHRLNRHHLTEK